MAQLLNRIGKRLRPQPTRSSQAHAEDTEGPNTLMIEAFEWYSPADGQHWKRLREALPILKQLGVDRIWIPPACKAGSRESNGYDIYDLYDLGEFNQKGTVATKWGTKDELVNLSQAAKAQGIGLVFDAVLGHKAAADYTQRVDAYRVDPKDRRKALEKPHEIEAWIGFDYAGRGGKYSQMKYNAEHFNATSYDNATRSGGIYKLSGKEWAQDVDKTNGNAEYLLCNNLDLGHPDTRNDIQDWSRWAVQELGLAGLRLDAVKHMSRGFTKSFVQCWRKEYGSEWFIVGEYCTSDNAKTLTDFINVTDRNMRLFDFPLVRNFSGISQHKDADLRYIFGGSLSEKMPENAVTFVNNHDTQERVGQDDPMLGVQSDFIPAAYAVILLNHCSRYPCLFWGDLFGVSGPGEPKKASHSTIIAKLAMIRQLYAYGAQNDYLDDRSCIGFTRSGSISHSQGAGVAIVISKSALPQIKRMNVGQHHAGERWTAALSDSSDQVAIDQKGWASFPTEAADGTGKVAIWIDTKAHGRERLDSMKI